ncbi:MAG: heterodisulfide reductase-related iron-sulfur binding cluster [Dehalococcoidia bacterium]|nr:heterodisulfide reductase-related iron-sulfur binding cluster [Dehalococcoidia bacterium]
MTAITRTRRNIDAPAFEDMQRCVHCGYCICDCPTYLALGTEAESPRGRLHLISALAEGRVSATAGLVAHLDRCVQCRACETACPSGVAFGRIMERGRALVLRGGGGRPPLGWRLRASLASLLLPHPGRLRFLAGLLRFYQRSGFQKLVRSTRLLKLLPGRLYEMEQFLPPLPDRVLAPVEVTRPSGDVPAHRVALLVGCVTPVLYPNLHEATVRVLVRNGCEVVVPPKQTCCGALHVHAGDLKAARRLARQNIDVFLALGVEAVITSAAGCGSTMKEYGELLKDDPKHAEKAATFSALVKDVTEYLVALPFNAEMGTVRGRVTYQDSCHLAHAQKIKAQPRAILEAIPGLDFVELPQADRCCGSGGVYSLTQPEMSWRLLEEKMKRVAETKAGILATANTGCMMQLQAGLRRFGPKKTQMAHVVELLDEAYRAVEND